MGYTGATSMRSVEHDNNNAKPSGIGSMAHSLTGLVGGKRRRSKKARKTKRSKSSRSKSSRSKSSRSKRVKRGGMGFGFGAALKEAIVPFGIFALQKRSQRNKQSHKRYLGKKPFRKSRSSRL